MKNFKLVWLLAAISLLPTPLPVFSSEDGAAEMSGLWGSERSLGPEARGELTIVQEGMSWRAMIAGIEAPVRFTGGALTFVLAGGRGEFRGRINRDATKISGHWIQPLTAASGNRYATPVELRATQSKVWRGQVVPLDDRVSLYLVIRQQTDGSTGAFIRDPERNAGRFLRIGSVRREGENVRFLDREGKELLAGRYDKQSGLLSIAFPFYGATLDFTRRRPDEATGFYPRTPEVSRYVYHQPLAETDGWTTASLKDVGLDPAPLAALVQRILQTKTEGITTPYIQGLLVARKGKLVLEEYFYGFDKDRPHDMRSASKSLTAALVGIAIDRGAHFDATTPVYSLFPEYKGFAHDDPRKRQVTVEHLLTMTAGFDCDDFNGSNPGNEDVMQGQNEQRDWYKYTLDLPMARQPGERAVYCSGGINLLGGIISNTTRTWLPDFFNEHYASPLDIYRYHINLTPEGHGYMGGGINMRPRDFMKLGQLFLNGGRWNGRQVLSRQWIERATRAHSSLNRKNDYGYAWHIAEYRVGQRTYTAFSAEGNGGQLLIAIPELDLLVMMTAGNYSDFPTWSKFRDELVPQFIIPSAAH
jgi:CubicO group peptidase (beta-lactamase class C family)